jgi:hypothetical protein
MGSEIYLLPLAASICLLVALVQAWIMTLVRYLKVTSIKKIFPSYRDLVRSHVDYIIMSALIFAVYLVVLQLQIVLPSIVMWLIFIGALYNPFGFILQAIKPNIVEAGGLVTKVGVVVGFTPLSVGLISTAIEIISVVTARL